MQELSLIRPGGLCENEVCLFAFAWDSYGVKKSVTTTKAATERRSFKLHRNYSYSLNLSKTPH